MIPAIVATGPSAQKERFFVECSAAFHFLATFYTLSREAQEELLQTINAASIKEKQDTKKGKGT